MNLPAGCSRCPLNRRSFISRAGVITASAFAISGLPTWLKAGEPGRKARLRIIYSLHTDKQDRPDWPNKGFDFKPVIDRFNRELRKRCKAFDFESATAVGEEQARKIVEEDKTRQIDGYIVFQMNCWNRVIQPVAMSGKPVLYADYQYGGSGGFLVYNAAFQREQSGNVAFVASSQVSDLAAAVNCFGIIGQGGTSAEFVRAVTELRLKNTAKATGHAPMADTLKCLTANDCLARLKHYRILAVRGQEAGAAGEVAGIQIQHVPFSELNDAWKQADQDEANGVVKAWQKAARKIIDVSPETLRDSAAMYLAQKALLNKYGAQGITVNCLGGFYGGHIHAYPCLGFHQLNNEGLVGGCECDVRSAATMLIGTTLTQGRPGYISDPVIDTAKRQIIYAHCVAPNKAFGPQGYANGFEILTHSEDRQGASVRSFLPVGYMTTSLEFDQGRKEILLHRALAVGNDPDDRACRTKLCAEPVGDIEKLFRMWDQWGWHRVTFYGDLKEPVYSMADALGWKVVEEA